MDLFYVNFKVSYCDRLLHRKDDDIGLLKLNSKFNVNSQIYFYFLKYQCLQLF